MIPNNSRSDPMSINPKRGDYFMPIHNDSIP